MSHFLTLALVDRDAVKERFGTIDLDDPQAREFIEDKVNALLAPYDGNIEAEPYETECSCVNFIAVVHGRKKAEEVKQMAVLRNEYHSLTPDDRPEWEDFTKEWEEIADHETKAHPLYMKPNPNCEECHGAGKVKTTYNPKSKWDWWAIGGRWTGYISGYDPSKDPDNIETCDLCGGTGMRTDMEIPNGCNGCDGKGQSLKWPTQWKRHNGDMRLLSAIKKEIDVFAIVTPDGEWHEAGEMGWFAIVSNENAQWPEKQKALIEKYKDCIVVACDMHV